MKKVIVDPHAEQSHSRPVLDPSSQAVDYDLVRVTLEQILDAMGLAPSMDVFQDLAGQLSTLAHKSPPWGAKYVYGVYRGYSSLLPSPALAAAVIALAQTLDSTPIGLAGAEFVRVLAYPGTIPEGALVPASAHVIRCSRPGCPILFIQTNPAQRYHDSSCARAWARERRKQQSNR